MKNMKVAKKYLKEENLSLVVVKDGKLIFKSHDKGIKPMYTLATEILEDSKDSVIADRVIGKGAAMLCKHIGVKEIYGQLMSHTAMKVLKESNIEYTYDRSCPYIKNRDKTGICPIEKIALDTADIDILLEEINDFLDKISKSS